MVSLEQAGKLSRGCVPSATWSPASSSLSTASAVHLVVAACVPKPSVHLGHLRAQPGQYVHILLQHP